GILDEVGRMILDIILDVSPLKIGNETNHPVGVDLPVVTNLTAPDETLWFQIWERAREELGANRRDARVSVLAPAISRIPADTPAGPTEHRRQRGRLVDRLGQVGGERRAGEQQRSPSQTYCFSHVALGPIKKQTLHSTIPSCQHHGTIA